MNEDDRRMHAAKVAPLEARKARIKEINLTLDRAILRLERYVADNS
jgi:hypothetical protein